MNHQDAGLRTRTVVWSGLGAFAVLYVLLRLVSDSGRPMPQNSWMTVPILMLVGVPLLVLAWQIKGYVEGRTREPPHPQLARRVLVAARAAGVAGAIAAGWYAAQVLVLAPNADVPSQRSALWLAAALALASVLLSIAGLVAQSWCRLPPEDDGQAREGNAAPA